MQANAFGFNDSLRVASLAFFRIEQRFIIAVSIALEVAAVTFQKFVNAFGRLIFLKVKNVERMFVVADVNEKIAVHATMLFLRNAKRCRRRIGIDAVAVENFRLRNIDERFEHGTDDITPTTD